MAAVCNACGKEWPRHPALEVQCPICNAAVGAGCSRPSGHAGPLIEPHAEREQRAVEEGVLDLCPEGPARKKQSAMQKRAPETEPQPALL